MMLIGKKSIVFGHVRFWKLRGEVYVMIIMICYVANQILEALFGLYSQATTTYSQRYWNKWTFFFQRN